MTDPTGLGTTAPAAPLRRAHLSLVPTPPGLSPDALPAAPLAGRRRTAVRAGDSPLLAAVTDDASDHGAADLFRTTDPWIGRADRPGPAATPTAPAPTPTVAARHLVVDALAAGTAALLSDAGVAALLIGGPVIARQIHHPVGRTRGYAAVDLLVHPAAVPAATDALRDHGYRPEGLDLTGPTGPTGCHRWRSPGSGAITVRLHSLPAGVDRPAGLFRELWEERAMLVFAGAEAPAPSARGIALLVALAAGRGPTAPRSGRQDLAQAVQTFGPDTWLRAADLARTCRAQEAFRAGLDTLRTPSAAPRIAATPATRPGPSLPAAARAMIRGVRNAGERRGAGPRPAAAGWAVAALLSARRQLTTAGVTDVELPAPPQVRAADRSAVVATLDEQRATCLERSLVLQRFDADGGRPRELVVAVTDPGPDRTPGCAAADGDPVGAVHAHAWLEGDTAPQAGFRELLRSPAPGALPAGQR
ncbi:nucleotidyltransferase family protein [Nakamurella leprariae]|uniref:Nucleotidyltransferase family protein n=1 Tax=Nakamurella leprariae TaxID=2803911 RepID=A0A939C3I7_9ACTN|nr:nucleotidyltransferase family protein [Nakamurella leprariae]MBM9469137.1 nucleotidyltransferase family protein [Nakamurella leprariae]